MTLLVALSGLTAQAQDSAADRQRAMTRYMQVVSMSEMMEDTYADMARRMPEGFVAQLKQ